MFQTEKKPSPESRRVDSYLSTISRLEPEVAAIDASAFYASAAISLKRSADTQERVAKAIAGKFSIHRFQCPKCGAEKLDYDSPIDGYTCQECSRSFVFKEIAKYPNREIKPSPEEIISQALARLASCVYTDVDGHESIKFSES